MAPCDLQRCHDADDNIPIEQWLRGLDPVTRARVRAQIDKMEDGNFGDVEPIGAGLSELRMHFGAGYRVYFALRGKTIHLLGGGTKRTQPADIVAARMLWRNHA